MQANRCGRPNLPVLQSGVPAGGVQPDGPLTRWGVETDGDGLVLFVRAGGGSRGGGARGRVEGRCFEAPPAPLVPPSPSPLACTRPAAVQNDGRTGCAAKAQLVFIETCSKRAVALGAAPLTPNSRRWVLEDAEGYPEGIKRVRTRTRAACGAQYLGVRRACTTRPTLGLFSGADAGAVLLWGVTPTVGTVCPSSSWTYRECVSVMLLPGPSLPMPRVLRPHVPHPWPPPAPACVQGSCCRGARCRPCLRVPRPPSCRPQACARCPRPPSRRIPGRLLLRRHAGQRRQELQQRDLRRHAVRRPQGLPPLPHLQLRLALALRRPRQ